MIRKDMIKKLNQVKAICELMLEVRETDMSRINEVKKNKEFRDLNVRRDTRSKYIKRLLSFDKYIPPSTVEKMRQTFDIYKRDILGK